VEIIVHSEGRVITNLFHCNGSPLNLRDFLSSIMASRGSIHESLVKFPQRIFHQLLPLVEDKKPDVLIFFSFVQSSWRDCLFGLSEILDPS